MTKSFTLVGIRPQGPGMETAAKPKPKAVPYMSIVLLAVIVLGCLFAEAVMTKDPTYLDLKNVEVAPNGAFLFGTDSLGRDIFSCIWYGGRESLFIGFFATLISTLIGVLYGTVSGLSPKAVDGALMRATEIILSVPGLLLLLFVQAILGKPNALTVSVAIGITSWCTIAKVVRMEVRRLRNCDYVLAARCMGGRFFYILKNHLVPNFIPSIVFIVVMNVRTAIGMEATLSFLGMGLPLETISWGSMLSLAGKTLLSKVWPWWSILIPGVFLVSVMLCLTNVGNFLRKNAEKKENEL